MSLIADNRPGDPAIPPSTGEPGRPAGHPVFRGLEAARLPIEDLAAMVGEPAERLRDWRSGRMPMPPEWAILLTRMLGALVHVLEHSGRRARVSLGIAGLDEEAGDILLARNWLELAREAIRDFEPDAHAKADRLARARVRAGETPPVPG